MSTIAVKKVKLGDNADTSKNFLIEVPAVADGSLTIKQENGTAVLSINAAGKAVIPGVVGTVAQVGGVPTGQVVERGSNGNGEYVRFADGTQICRVDLAFVADGRVTWSFPAIFSAKPFTACSPLVNNGDMGDSTLAVGFEDGTTSSVRVAKGIAGSRSARLLAQGRWF